MKSFNVNVLETPYLCMVGKREELKDLDNDLQGCCRNYTKEILICDEFDGASKAEYSVALEEVVTHELSHAFLYESGMVSYSSDERLVEWLSINVSKLLRCSKIFIETLGLTDE